MAEPLVSLTLSGSLRTIVEELDIRRFTFDFILVVILTMCTVSLGFVAVMGTFYYFTLAPIIDQTWDGQLVAVLRTHWIAVMVLSCCLWLMSGRIARIVRIIMKERKLDADKAS